MNNDNENLDLDPNPHPEGELATQTIALPADTNQDGEIHGGWSSIRVSTEAWVSHVVKGEEWRKVSEGVFTFVAFDSNGRTRAIPKT
ncbi:MAG: hypothetical protein P8J61_03960 [Gammaproteobacteria bacterium]|jgi:acyl-CoA hydrolase|nr:hypothetical protein [Gammaproteobacteria bacterium]